MNASAIAHLESLPVMTGYRYALTAGNPRKDGTIPVYIQCTVLASNGNLKYWKREAKRVLQACASAKEANEVIMSAANLLNNRRREFYS